MQGDPKVIEYLDRGLRHGLTAVSQYWLHYRLLENWGFRRLADKWREESIEEMRHADRFIECIIFLDGRPKYGDAGSSLHRARCSPSAGQRFEGRGLSARPLSGGAEYCHSVRDYPSRNLF